MTPTTIFEQKLNETLYQVQVHPEGEMKLVQKVSPSVTYPVHRFIVPISAFSESKDHPNTHWLSLFNLYRLNPLLGNEADELSLELALVELFDAGVIPCLHLVVSQDEEEDQPVRDLVEDLMKNYPYGCLTLEDSCLYYFATIQQLGDFYWADDLEIILNWISTQVMTLGEGVTAPDLKQCITLANASLTDLLAVMTSRLYHQTEMPTFQFKNEPVLTPHLKQIDDYFKTLPHWVELSLYYLLMGVPLLAIPAEIKAAYYGLD